MEKIQLGYTNDFTGRASDLECADFTNENISKHYMLSDDASLIIRRDGVALYIQNGKGRLYVSSNHQYSYSLTTKPGTVILKF